MTRVHLRQCPFTSWAASLRLEQDGTATGEDYFKAIAVAKDGGYLVVGDTEGDWNGASAGDKDFVAVKLRLDLPSVVATGPETCDIDTHSNEATSPTFQSTAESKT